MTSLKRTLATLGLIPALVFGNPCTSAACTETSTPVAMSSASSCTPSGIVIAYAPTPTSPAPAPTAQFDDSTVVCDSSAVVGSSLHTVQIIIRQNCDSSADVKKDTGAPIVVTTTADDLNTITLQMRWTFGNDNTNITLSDDNCSRGFMYAITECSNSDRPLTSGGSAAPTYSGLPVRFEASVLDSRSRKRDDSWTTISIAPKPSSSSLDPSRAVVPASSITPSPLSTATGTDSVQGHGDATNKTDLRRRNTSNFVVCDTSGPTAKLTEMQQVTDTFCNKYNGATLNNEDTVTVTYLLSGGNARVSAKSYCDRHTIALSACRASFGNVIADCSLDGVPGRGGKDETDCVDFIISVLSGLNVHQSW